MPIKKQKSKSKTVKIRHVYTVTREMEIPASKLDEEINFFGGVKDEAGEYLYGGTNDKETIEVEMQIGHDNGNNWQTIEGDPR